MSGSPVAKTLVVGIPPLVQAALDLGGELVSTQSEFFQCPNPDCRKPLAEEACAKGCCPYCDQFFTIP